MKIKIVFPALFILLFTNVDTIYTQNVSVNLNTKYSVNGVAQLDRSKFFILHHSVTDSDWDSEAKRERFLNDNDVYMGRSTGRITSALRNTNEDPNKKGWPDIKHIQQQGAASREKYAKTTTAHAFENRAKMMVVGGQPLRVYPNGQKTPKGWAYANYEAVAELYAHYLSEYYGAGGVDGPPKPRYLEVFNEPFVKAGKLGTTTANISRFHSVVAKRVKEMHPDVMVGGYGAAHPAYEAANFKHWENRWKTFIDVAGEDMDFYSYHLYDGHKDQASPQTKRKGSNMEAIMDMIEHYSVLKHGKRKPVYITEFGYFLREAVPYNKQSDWYQLRSYNSMLMQLMERQDILIGAIPFMILKAEWGRTEDGIPYGPRIMRQKKEVPGFEGNGEDWVYTDLIKYYQFWKEVKGTRAASSADNIDILTDTYIHENKAYVLISNLSTEDRTLHLNVKKPEGITLSQVTVSHIHANDKDEAVWDQYNTDHPDQIEIGREATMILTFEYDKTISQNEHTKETKYFADDYLKAIDPAHPVSVKIKGVKKAKNGEAILRLGLGRTHGLSLTPDITVNGKSISVPTNWRGDDQQTRKEFFGLLEIPIPYKWVKKNNNISISFKDKGGHISSISMQHFSHVTKE